MNVRYYKSLKLIIYVTNRVCFVQPRILMAMARDGLLPSFFSDVSKKSQVPVNSTVTTGIVAALMAFFLDVSQLAGMVSVL